MIGKPNSLWTELKIEDKVCISKVQCFGDECLEGIRFFDKNSNEWLERIKEDVETDEDLDWKDEVAIDEGHKIVGIKAMVEGNKTKSIVRLILRTMKV